MSQHLIVGFVVVFMLATVALSVAGAWVSFRQEAHVPEPLRDEDEASEG